jgi:D-alanyl-D-alanine carboxypeptidase
MHIYDVVSKDYPLQETYIPKTLIYDKKFKIWLCRNVQRAFYHMNRCMKKDGIDELVLVSGYRSYDYQKGLYEKKVNKMIERGLTLDQAKLEAATIVAPPGCSEHQTGLAIDVTAYAMKDFEDPLCEEFENTLQSKWMLSNGYHFGFILRYPKDKIMLTGITYEPWHYRYVGKENARKIHELNLCLEEYVLLKTFK